MNPVIRAVFTGLLMAGACLLGTSTSHAAGQSRAEYLNLSTAETATQEENPGVAFFGGYIRAPGDPQSGAVVLQECAFGQPFSQWYPSDTYGAEIVAAVRGALYPTETTRAGIEGSGKPFRYKWLMYDGDGTDVTAFDAASIADWFTQDDRDIIAAQIGILKEAVAASPFDTSIRNTLLDTYYDLAVAEMQAVKPMLARLAILRLGLDDEKDPNTFVIDEEIATYEAITTTILAAINQYTSLLSEPFPNIDPSSIDPDRVAFGEMPMGRYIFLREQPRRSSVPSKYANQSGIQEVPQIDEDGNLVTPGTLFVGYKDLNTLLQIVGQRQQHLAALARLRGTRKAPGDVALARESLTQVAGADVTQLQLIKSWFPELFPSDLKALSEAERDIVAALLQQSGVLASLSAIELGRVDLASVAPLLNGNANILGYDPNFLLLVQDTGGSQIPKESFDTLRELLKGDNQPLTVALDKFEGAKEAYNNFQEKVDRVAADIDDVDEALADRFVAITGFEPGADPAFNLDDPNPKPGFELDGIIETIAALDEQANLRKDITAELDSQFKVGVDGAAGGAAQKALNAARAKEAAIKSAADTYKNKTESFYTTMIAASATAAGAQAAYDTVSDTAAVLAGADFSNLPSIAASSTAAKVTAVTGTVNTAVQVGATTAIGLQEKYIDYAAIDFTVATETNDSALLINQAAQQLSAVKREQVANQMEQLGDTSARNQAEAQKAALLAELARIVIKRDSKVAAIQKKSYADPLHYRRAEYALIDADESFRTAQIWMFYTLQALNYKWHGRFAINQGSKFYDSSTVFSCRNAAELDDLLTQMVRWDDIRVVQTVDSARLYTRISMLEHVLARNPKRYDPVDSTDPGVRADDTVVGSTGPPQMLPTLQYFRKVLAEKYIDENDDLVIPFSTAFKNQIVDRVDGNFFRGASYDADGNITDPGFWREKIEFVKVNIVAADAPALPANLDGRLTYGGTMYFHTRVPPRSDRSIAGLDSDDAPGELLVAPFRYWSSPDFSFNFKSASEQTASIAVAYSQSTAIVQGPNGIQDNLGPTYQVNAFTGRSIAASGWKFGINLANINGFRVDVDNIYDIELIIVYKHSDRVTPSN